MLFKKAIAAALLTLWGMGCVEAIADDPKRPNFIVILADDMGFSDAGCYGGEIHTPNLDELAKQGLRFTQFYNASKCGPTRTSLLSGLYWQEARNGIQRGLTLGEAMRSCGYATLAAGKWHVSGNPVDRGFDHWFGFLNGFTNYFKGDASFRADHSPYEVPKGGFYTTDAFTEAALRFLDENRKQSPAKPFFLYLAYNAPHDPLQAPAEDIALYQHQYDRGWDVLRRERYERQIAQGVINAKWTLPERPEGIPAWETLSELSRQREASRMAVYAAMIDRMDRNIGRLLAKLKKWDLEDNTLIMFLSDNGANPYDRTHSYLVPPGGADTDWSTGMGWANLSNAPFRLYKRNQLEGGVATPFIVRWPAVIKNGGAIIDQPAHVIDLMPTLLALSGGDYLKACAEVKGASAECPPLSGVDLSPLFRREAWKGHDSLFFQLLDERAVRAGDWKLASHDGAPWELYEMNVDRTETHDVSHDQPNERERLESLYARWWNQDGIFKKTKAISPARYTDPGLNKCAPDFNVSTEDD